MLQVIGLIVAVYCMGRMVQAPFFVVGDGRKDIPYTIKLVVISIVSALALVALLFLTNALLNSGNELPSARSYDTRVYE